MAGRAGDCPNRRKREGAAQGGGKGAEKGNPRGGEAQTAHGHAGGAAADFGLLALLKYTDDVRSWFGASPLGLLLPLGISFYTFQSMGYLLDVYNGKYAPQKNPARFALFVSFFPQVIQGPIGRYDQLEKQLEGGGQVDVPRAFLLMLWGLAKKMVIADRALPMVSAVFDAPGGTWGGAMAVVGVLAYSVQQY